MPGSRRCVPSRGGVLVAVGDHDAGEVRQDAEVAERFQAAGAQEQQRVLLGEGAEDVFLLPGRADPQRGLIEPGYVRGGDQRPDQLDHIGGQPGGGAQAGADKSGRDLRPGDVADQAPTPLNGHMLEDDQINGQGTQVRPDRHGSPAPRGDERPRAGGRSRTIPGAGRAGCAARTALVSPAAGTTGPRPDSALWPGHPRTSTPPAGSDRGYQRVRPRSSPIRAPPAACRPCVSPRARQPAAACAGACGPGRRHLRAASRNSGCYATAPASAGPPGARDLGHLLLQRGYLRITGRAASATRARGGQIGHKP